MSRLLSLRLPIAMLLAIAAGCDAFTDPATRLAYAIEAGASHLGADAGARYSIQNMTPAKRNECSGPYRVQFDKVGALIIWCKDASGTTVSSHSTSYHARFVDTPQTFILDKAAGSTLTMDVERRDGRAVITDVR